MATFGSLINSLSAGPQLVVPTPGMGVTILHWSDRSAGTISRVSMSGKVFWYRPDLATRVDTNGMSESQEYTYAPQPDAAEVRVSQRKNGRWQESKGGHAVAIGSRRAYYDYTF